MSKWAKGVQTWARVLGYIYVQYWLKQVNELNKDGAGDRLAQAVDVLVCNILFSVRILQSATQRRPQLFLFEWRGSYQTLYKKMVEHQIHIIIKCSAL